MTKIPPLPSTPPPTFLASNIDKQTLFNVFMYKYVLNFQGNPIYLFLNPFISLFDSVCLLQTAVSSISVRLSIIDGCNKYNCQFVYYRRLCQVYLSVSLLQRAESGIFVSLSTTDGCMKYICQLVYCRGLN